MPYKHINDQRAADRRREKARRGQKRPRRGSIHDPQPEEHTAVKRYLSSLGVSLPNDWKKLTFSQLDAMEEHIANARKALGYEVPGQTPETAD